MTGDLRVRRLITQAMIQLADKFQGGLWSVTSLDESGCITVIKFETDRPIKSEPGESAPYEVTTVEITLTTHVRPLAE